MDYRITLVFFAVLLFAGTVFAQKEVEAANKYIEENKAFFESELVQTLFGNERMNITINRNDGTIVKFGVIAKNGKVDEYQQPAIENPTVNITATEDALINIRAAVFDPQAEFQKQLDAGNIKYEPIGIFSTIKFGGLGLVSSVFSIFKNIFAPPMVTDNCYSEDGNDRAKQGTTIKGSTTFIDECTDGSTLKEYYCSSKDVTFKFYDCSCSEGICAE